MGNLTSEIPKPMLVIGNKNLLEHKIERLPTIIDEIVFVVGYKGDSIRSYFGNTHGGRKIHYVVQEKLEGTGKALWCAKPLLHEKFIVMNGDDIYAEEDISKCLVFDFAILAKKRKEEEQGARIILNEEGKLKDIVELFDQMSEHKKSDLINTGVYVLSKEFFDYELVKLTGKEEWGLPQTVVSLAKDHPVDIVVTDYWIPMTSPGDLEMGEKILTK